MKALIKKPDCEPQMTEIPNTLESLQKAVDGHIEAVTMTSTGCAVLCNEDGWLLSLPYNCELQGHDFLGTILIVGTKGDEFCDIPFTEDDAKIIFKSLWEADSGDE